MSEELHCPICGMSPRQVYIEGDQYECPNKNCELYDLRLLEKVFSVSLLESKLRSEYQLKTECQKAIVILQEENERLKAINPDCGGTHIFPYQIEALEKKLSIAREALEKYKPLAVEARFWALEALASLQEETEKSK